MAQNITIAGVQYPDVPSVNFAKTGGGTAPFFDVSDTTALAADVRAGKIFHLANGDSATGLYVWDWMGEDAECIDDNVHAYSATLDYTGFATWTPSTTAATIVASETKTARAINTGTYDYFLRWIFTADVAYTSGVTMKAVPIRQVIELWQTIIKRPSSLANLKIPTFTANGCVTLYTCPIMEYYNTSGSHTMTYTGSYGFYPAAVAATFSSSTSDTPNLTIKTPSISARCNSSYFATARAPYVDQPNSILKLRGELWRMKRSNLGESMYISATNIYNNPLPIYTYGIKNTLTNCTSSNSATRVNVNEAYSATITADAGYTLTGAAVTVTMDGNDITSTAYNNGVISIASVTGNVAITVSAVAA
jgi:hypothetical protein